MLHAFIKNGDYGAKNWSNVTMALTTQGNFRVPLNKGNLTYNHLITMCPWENKLYALTLRGRLIRDLMEDSVAPMRTSQLTPSSSRFLQVAGIRVRYNISLPIGGRLIGIKVRCALCKMPSYVDLQPDEEYRVVVMEYLANGKNGFELISENAKDLEEGPEDLEAFIDFMHNNEPITAGLEGRIQIYT